MFRRLKTFLETLFDAVKSVDRLEQHMVLQDRRVKLLEQRQNHLFDEVLDFINKQQAMKEMEEAKQEKSND